MRTLILGIALIAAANSPTALEAQFTLTTDDPSFEFIRQHFFPEGVNQPDWDSSTQISTIMAFAYRDCYPKLRRALREFSSRLKALDGSAVIVVGGERMTPSTWEDQAFKAAAQLLAEIEAAQRGSG